MSVTRSISNTLFRILPLMDTNATTTTTTTTAAAAARGNADGGNGGNSGNGGVENQDEPNENGDCASLSSDSSCSSCVSSCPSFVNERKPLGPYRLVKTLENGEFGKIKLGIHTETGQKVAIKVIKKNKDAANLSKVEREIEVLKSLRHPHIVKLIEVIETDTRLGIILEYASGGELFEYVLSHRSLEEDTARNLFAQLISSVNHMHRKGIVHRDLKLENLLFLDAQQTHIIVSDFGFAHGDTNNKDLLATCCGSPTYAAPELVYPSGGYKGPAADVWSCGVILYCMVCGYLPFDDNPDIPDNANIHQLYQYIRTIGTPSFPEFVSEDAQDLIRKMLQVDPAKRCTVKTIINHPWLQVYQSTVFAMSTEQLEQQALDSIKKHHAPPASIERYRPNSHHGHHNQLSAIQETQQHQDEYEEQTNGVQTYNFLELNADTVPSHDQEETNNIESSLVNNQNVKDSGSIQSTTNDVIERGTGYIPLELTQVSNSIGQDQQNTKPVQNGEQEHLSANHKQDQGVLAQTQNGNQDRDQGSPAESLGSNTTHQHPSQPVQKDLSQQNNAPQPVALWETEQQELGPSEDKNETPSQSINGSAETENGKDDTIQIQKQQEKLTQHNDSQSESTRQMNLGHQETRQNIQNPQKSTHDHQHPQKLAQENQRPQELAQEGQRPQLDQPIQQEDQHRQEPAQEGQRPQLDQPIQQEDQHRQEPAQEGQRPQLDQPIQQEDHHPQLDQPKVQKEAQPDIVDEKLDRQETQIEEEQIGESSSQQHQIENQKHDQIKAMNLYGEQLPQHPMDTMSIATLSEVNGTNEKAMSPASLLHTDNKDLTSLPVLPPIPNGEDAILHDTGIQEPKRQRQPSLRRQKFRPSLTGNEPLPINTTSATNAHNAATTTNSATTVNTANTTNTANTANTANTTITTVTSTTTNNSRNNKVSAIDKHENDGDSEEFIGIRPSLLGKDDSTRYYSATAQSKASARNRISNHTASDSEDDDNDNNRNTNNGIKVQNLKTTSLPLLNHPSSSIGTAIDANTSTTNLNDAIKKYNNGVSLSSLPRKGRRFPSFHPGPRPQRSQSTHLPKKSDFKNQEKDSSSPTTPTTASPTTPTSSHKRTMTQSFKAWIHNKKPFSKHHHHHHHQPSTSSFSESSSSGEFGRHGRPQQHQQHYNDTDERRRSRQQIPQNQTPSSPSSSVETPTIDQLSGMRTLSQAQGENLTSMAPGHLILALVRMLTALGIDVKHDSSYQLTCLRKSCHHQKHSFSKKRNSKPFTALNAPIYGPPELDHGHHVGFTVEICRSLLSDLHVVDIQLTDGDTLAFQFLRSKLLALLNLNA